MHSYQMCNLTNDITGKYLNAPPGLSGWHFWRNKRLNSLTCLHALQTSVAHEEAFSLEKYASSVMISHSERNYVNCMYTVWKIDLLDDALWHTHTSFPCSYL